MIASVKSWVDSLSVYIKPQVLAVLFLGFSSGLPLPLTGATLDAVLNEAGVTKTTIGLFAAIGIPYSLKFLWAPFIDGLRLPVLSRWLGRRRSWMVVSQLGLLGCIIALGMSNPAENIGLTASLALGVAFLSASQDIIVDAYRIESLHENEQGAGASSYTFGYIVAMKLVGGALAFYLSDILGWTAVYTVMGLFMVVGIITVMIAGEPQTPEGKEALESHRNWLDWCYHNVIEPFAQFMSRPSWWLILAFVVFYKCGDAFAGKMLTPFLQDIGFSNKEIGAYLKTFGLGATLVGTFLGGVIVYRFGMIKALWIGGFLQIASNLMFVVQANVGYNGNVLMVTVIVENVSGGLGTAAFVAYLSSLCHVAFTATQYALLSSFASVGRTMLSASSGWFVDTVGWVDFFLVSMVVALPGLVVLWLLQSQLSKTAKPSAPN